MWDGGSGMWDEGSGMWDVGVEGCGLIDCGLREVGCGLWARDLTRRGSMARRNYYY